MSETPFPFPDGYFQDHRNTLGAKSIRDYVKIFERRRNERPGGKFADADIQELMRLAEDVRRVHRYETQYLRELVEKHPDYFRDDAQKGEIGRFADVHDAFNQASKGDEFVEEILEVPPIGFFRQPGAMEFIDKAQEISLAVQSAEASHAESGTYDPDRLRHVDQIAQRLGQLVDGFTLSDVDEPGKAARKVHKRDIANLLNRLGGKTDHESKWFEEQRRWVNWNRDIEVFPEVYEEPKNRQKLEDLLDRSGPLRMVAGGHAFNISSSMGGRKGSPIGTLATLDEYRLDSGRWFEKVDPVDAVGRYHVSQDQAQRVVRVSAGMRLRDFGKAMWNEGMALPVAGSTDAQSIGGLIATDLHSTGRTAGFLSQQLLEVKALSSDKAVVHFVKDESTLRGDPARWSWTAPDGSLQRDARLPVSGALGMAGIVIEAVIKLDAAFNLRKSQQFVPRLWAEGHIEQLLDPAETNPLFAYDHVSFYYPGGAGADIKTIRMNSWRRTDEPISEGAENLKTIREIFDHVGSAFLPEYLLRLARRQAPVPGQPSHPDDDDWLKTLNKRPPLVLAANEAFARKLFFQHDEIEVGIPLPLKRDGKPDYDVFRAAIAHTQELLQQEEFETIIEVRFTPDASEAMLGPGTGGPTCYIELATPLGEVSRRRIAEVSHKFDKEMRERFQARPHLGKKTSANFQDMEDLYQDIWDDFQAVREQMDRNDKFFPPENTLLRQIFEQ